MATRREGERSGDDAFGIEPNWAATGAEVEVSPPLSLPNSLVAVLAVGISPCLALSLSRSLTLRR